MSLADLIASPTIMGVLNVTPDSFSDGGKYLRQDAAIEHGLGMARAGAGIIDIGGESTRPGAQPVAQAEELHRVIPVVQALAQQADLILSVDTYKFAVAEAAADAGAWLVNDVYALRASPEIAGLCADRDLGLCLVHMRGTPQTMQDAPRYSDVVSEVKSFLQERIAFAISQGMNEEQILVDPGIGFGKTVAHNLELIARLDELAELGRPIVIGTSRKSFIGRLTGKAEATRLPGTVATNVLALARGATVFRVHDVAANSDALKVAQAVLAGRPATFLGQVARPH